MNKSRFNEYEMKFALEQAEKGSSISDICEVLGISTATFYNWRRKFHPDSYQRSTERAELENENKRLKDIIRDLENDKRVLLAEIKKRHQAL